MVPRLLSLVPRLLNLQSVWLGSLIASSGCLSHVVRLSVLDHNFFLFVHRSAPNLSQVLDHLRSDIPIGERGLQPHSPRSWTTCAPTSRSASGDYNLTPPGPGPPSLRHPDRLDERGLQPQTRHAELWQGKGQARGKRSRFQRGGGGGGGRVVVRIYVVCGLVVFWAHSCKSIFSDLSKFCRREVEELLCDLEFGEDHCLSRLSSELLCGEH